MTMASFNYGLISNWYNNDSLPELFKQLEIGDLLEFDRSLYRHWAVCVTVAGRGSLVIHRNATSSTGEFLFEKARMYLKDKELAGEYNLKSNNCEHFAILCRNKRKFSTQVEFAETAAAVAIGSFVMIGAAALLGGLLSNKKQKEDEEHQ
ncbi:hypothetical protein CHUAL_003513 [Chamberlinius hualienensis]